MYRWARGENLPHQVSLFPLEQKTKKIISVPFGLQEAKGFRVHTGSFPPQIPLLRGPNCRKAEDRSTVRTSGHQHRPPHQGSKTQNLPSLNYNSHSTRVNSRSERDGQVGGHSMEKGDLSHLASNGLLPSVLL